MPPRPSVVCTEVCIPLHSLPQPEPWPLAHPHNPPFSAIGLKLAVAKAIPASSAPFTAEYASTSVSLHPQCEPNNTPYLASPAAPTSPPLPCLAHLFHSANEDLQDRLLSFEQFYERERQRLHVLKQRTSDFSSNPPSETSSEARQDALLAACPSDVFRLFSGVLSLSPERVSSIQSAHATNRPPIPLFLLPDHYYYIDRDGDPCVTPALLDLLPSLDKQADLLNIVKDVFLFQPLGSYHDLLRCIDSFRNPPPAPPTHTHTRALTHLGLYAVAAGAFALGAVGSSRLVLSSTQATNLYNAGRRALQLVIDHPDTAQNSVDHLWSGMLLFQFLLFSHRLTGGEQPLSGAFHREWVRAEIDVVLRMVVHASGNQRETDQSPHLHSSALQEHAKLARAAYYYEM